MSCLPVNIFFQKKRLFTRKWSGFRLPYLPYLFIHSRQPVPQRLNACPSGPGQDRQHGDLSFRDEIIFHNICSHSLRRGKYAGRGQACTADKYIVPVTLEPREAVWRGQEDQVADCNGTCKARYSGHSFRQLSVKAMIYVRHSVPQLGGDAVPAPQERTEPQH